MSKVKKRKQEVESKKVVDKTYKSFPRLLGMKDFYGSEQLIYNFVTEKITNLAKAHGFSAVKTPILENYNLFKKSTRRNNDKDFYFAEAERGEKIILRPELTQGIIRAYLENIPADTPTLGRLFSLGSVFRFEKLQTGRYREITQFDLEIIGEKKPIIEAVLIAIASNFFAELNIDVQLQINSLGSSDCQKEYLSKLNNFFKEKGKRAKLCATCREGIGKNALSLLDCKEDTCLKLREELPQIADYLSDESREYFAKTLEFLDELNISYNFNPHLARGQSYYNDTIFEFWPINDDGSVNSKLSLGGGGRYDSLVASLGGPELPAIGLALGIERIVSRIKDKHLLTNEREEDIIFIAQLGEQAKLKSLQLFQDLKQAGFNVKQSFSSDSLKAQLEEASEAKAKICLILGKKEILDETILMRFLDSGAQETVVYKKIKERLSKKDKLVEKKLIIRKESGSYGRL